MLLLTGLLLFSVAVVNGVNVELLRPYNHTANQMFVAADVNSDNVVSLKELSDQLDAYDIDHNGHVSRHEYTAYTCMLTPVLYQISHYLFDEYDANGDHKLESSDYAILYGRMDTDGNNIVTNAEYVAWFVHILTNLEGMGVHYHGQSHEHGSPQCH